MKKRLLRLGFFALIILFLALYLRSIDFHKLWSLRVSWPWIILGSVLAVGYRYWAVVIWRVILRNLDVKELPPFTVMARVFAKAWMARYIPGTITWVAGRIYLASEYGISKSKLTVSSLLEGGMQVVTGIVIALPLLGFSGHVGDMPIIIKILAVVISLAFLLCLTPPVFNRLLHIAHLVIKRQKPGHELRVNGKAVLKSFLLFCCASAISGLANFAVAHSLDAHLGWNMLAYLVGTFSLAGALGIATPFLPSGLGVRDGTQIILLSLIMPKETALAIALLSRFWGIAVDAIFFGIAMIKRPKTLRLDQP